MKEQAMTKARTNDAIFADAYEVDDDGWESGITKEDLGRAIQVLQACHDKLTIPQAAAVFLVSPKLVSDVVEDHPWLYEADGIIQPDGL